MNLLQRISTYILPKEIDFFGNLGRQSELAENILEIMSDIYIHGIKPPDALQPLLEKAEDARKQNMSALNQVLITPIDREALSRMHIQLDWVILSLKHLAVEIRTYMISALPEYEKIFQLLQAEMKNISESFSRLEGKEFEMILSKMSEVIRMDDELIQEYACQLSNLFERPEQKAMLLHKEILTQLKEVSKRIHVCANAVEDIVFKMY